MLLVLLKAARAWLLQPLVEILGTAYRTDADRQRRKVVVIEIHETVLNEDQWSPPEGGHWTMDARVVDVEATAKNMQVARQQAQAPWN